jgi:hypothetical protein
MESKINEAWSPEEQRADVDPYAADRAWLLHVIAHLQGPPLQSLRQFLELTPVVAAVFDASQRC